MCYIRYKAFMFIKMMESNDYIKAQNILFFFKSIEKYVV